MKRLWLAAAAGAGLLAAALGVYGIGGQADVRTDGTGAVTVTLTDPGRSPLADADSLRKAWRLDEAVEAYRAIADDEGVEVEVRKEAAYYVGMCTLLGGDRDTARSIFASLMDTYRDDMNAVAHIEYCLAFADVQDGLYDEALSRLRRSLEGQACSDTELLAAMELYIGKIFLLYMNDREHATAAFIRVRGLYPSTEAARHPFVMNCGQ